MTVAVAQTAQIAVDAAATASVSFGSLPAAGSQIVATASPVRIDSDTPLAITASDNQGGTSYALAIESDEPDGSGTTVSEMAAVLYRENISAPSGTFTVTLDGGNGSTYWSVGIAEVTGIAASGSLDVIASNGADPAGADASPSTGTTGVTALADSIAFCAVGIATNSGTSGITAPSGFTNVNNHPDGTISQVGNGSYKVLSATGAQSAAWATIPAAGGRNNWAACIAVFKGVSGGGSGNAARAMHQIRQRRAA